MKKSRVLLYLLMYALFYANGLAAVIYVNAEQTAQLVNSNTSEYFDGNGLEWRKDSQLNYQNIIQMSFSSSGNSNFPYSPEEWEYYRRFDESSIRGTGLSYDAVDWTNGPMASVYGIDQMSVAHLYQPGELIGSDASFSTAFLRYEFRNPYDEEELRHGEEILYSQFPDDTLSIICGFRNIASGAGDYYYGWVRFSLSIETDEWGHQLPSANLVDFAYESEAGVPIAAGAVPEPATLSLLALGGLALLRRRK